MSLVVCVCLQLYWGCPLFRVHVAAARSGREGEGKGEREEGECMAQGGKEQGGEEGRRESAWLLRVLTSCGVALPNALSLASLGMDQ